MNTDAPTLYKLMVLYVLVKVESPLSNSQISQFILDRGYTNYFSLQEAISDLEDTGLISSSTRGTATFYSITDAGSQTLQDFLSLIPARIRGDMDSSLSQNAWKIRSENQITADYYQDADGDYVAHCYLTGGKELLSGLTLNVTDEEQARTICENWKKKYDEIYSFLVQTLLLDD